MSDLRFAAPAFTPPNGPVVAGSVPGPYREEILRFFLEMPFLGELRRVALLARIAARP